MVALVRVPRHQLRPRLQPHASHLRAIPPIAESVTASLSSAQSQRYVLGATIRLHDVRDRQGSSSTGLDRDGVVRGGVGDHRPLLHGLRCHPFVVC